MYKMAVLSKIKSHSDGADYFKELSLYDKPIKNSKEPFNFLTIDTMLPASDPLRFRKNLFDSYKNDNN